MCECFACMYTCTFVCASWSCTAYRRPEEGIISPRAGVLDSCEVPLGARNATQVLCKNSKCSLMTDSSLQPSLQFSTINLILLSCTQTLRQNWNDYLSLPLSLVPKVAAWILPSLLAHTLLTGFDDILLFGCLLILREPDWCQKHLWESAWLRTTLPDGDLGTDWV